MGYSARYHATSLIAIFLALAIGVVIGAALGGDTITKTRKDLEQSLTGNLEDARNHAEELSAELGQANAFADQVYPGAGPRRPARAPDRDRRDRRAAGRDRDRDRRRPRPDRGQAGRRRGRPRAGRHSLARGRRRENAIRRPRSEPDVQTEFATGVGRQLVLGGNLLERVRGHLFSRASGNFRALDGVIVVRDQPQDMTPVQRSTAARIESALLAGVTGTRTASVGVEATDAEPSSVSFFQSMTSPASTTSTRAPASLRRSSRCSAPRGASASRARPTSSCQTCWRRTENDLDRVPGGDRASRCSWSRPGSAACATPA